jgi:hypothetical protein
MAIQPEQDGKRLGGILIIVGDEHAACDHNRPACVLSYSAIVMI